MAVIHLSESFKDLESLDGGFIELIEDTVDYLKGNGQEIVEVAFHVSIESKVKEVTD